jgi:hypothetical protein
MDIALLSRHLGFAGFSLIGCALFLAASSASAKRMLPPDVAAVINGSVRYEAPHFNTPCAQNGGCLVAYDNTTNAQLWAVKVYCTKYDPSLEQDVQDVFVTSLALENAKLQVANEKGQHFAIDPQTQEVTGDARGCEQQIPSGGCSYAPSRTTSRLGWAALCLGLACLRSRKKARSVDRRVAVG